MGTYSNEIKDDYKRINWKNRGVGLTPLNGSNDGVNFGSDNGNLNNMDYNIKQHSTRIFEIYNNKAEKSDVNNQFAEINNSLLSTLENVVFDEKNGVFTFTWKNGATKSYDLNVEKIPVNFELTSDGILYMYTSDNEYYAANLMDVLVNYTFNSTDDVLNFVEQKDKIKFDDVTGKGVMLYVEEDGLKSTVTLEFNPYNYKLKPGYIIRSTLNKYDLVPSYDITPYFDISYDEDNNLLWTITNNTRIFERVLPFKLGSSYDSSTDITKLLDEIQQTKFELGTKKERFFDVSINKGSIKEEFIDPQFMAKINNAVSEAEGYKDAAQSSETNASLSESNASSFANESHLWANGGAESLDTPGEENNAKYYSDQAKASLDGIGELTEELKKSVSDGKSSIASAITTMGVATESDATFDTMSDNILNIPLGGTDVSDTTATAEDVVSGRMFYDADGTRTEGELDIIDVTPPIKGYTPLYLDKVYRINGYAGELVTYTNAITQSDVTLYKYMPLNKERAYIPFDENINAIGTISHDNLIPTGDGTLFDSGWNYMATPGYAYPSQVKGKSGTFTTSSTGITIDCGFKPTKVLIFSNPSSAGTYMHCDIYWDGTTCYIRTGGNKSACATGTNQTITPTSNGFTHKVMQTGASGYTAYYIAMP